LAPTQRSLLLLGSAESAAADFSQAPLILSYYFSLMVMLLSSFSQAPLKISYKSTWISSYSQAPLIVSYLSLMKVLLPVHVDDKCEVAPPAGPHQSVSPALPAMDLHNGLGLKALGGGVLKRRPARPFFTFTVF
jgi:hypothetical protein